MRITTVGLCVLLFPALVWAGTWRDDFEDGNMAGWEEVWWGSPGNWYIENGQLVLDRNSDVGTIQTLAGILHDNVTIEFDAKMEQPYPVAIANIEVDLRVQDADNFIFVPTGRWNNKWAAGVGLFWRGNIEIWQETPFPFEMGQWYHFKVVAQDNEFTLSINGNKVASLWESRLTSGKAGFGGIGSKTRFDNVVFTGPNVPDVDPSGIEPAGKLAILWGKLKAF